MAVSRKPKITNDNTIITISSITAPPDIHTFMKQPPEGDLRKQGVLLNAKGYNFKDKESKPVYGVTVQIGEANNSPGELERGLVVNTYNISCESKNTMVELLNSLEGIPYPVVIDLKIKIDYKNKTQKLVLAGLYTFPEIQDLIKANSKQNIQTSTTKPATTPATAPVKEPVETNVNVLTNAPKLETENTSEIVSTGTENEDTTVPTVPTISLRRSRNNNRGGAPV
jgi:hypothetical protein